MTAYVEEIMQQHVRLVFGYALDAACEASVDEDAFPSGYGWVFVSWIFQNGFAR
jgi:hypothetical protein